MHGTDGTDGYLSGEVGLVLAFFQAGGATPNVILETIVGPAGLKFWNEADLLFLLLCQILVESEGVVFFFFLISVFSANAIRLVCIQRLSWGRGGFFRGGAPIAGRGICGSAPIASRGICGSGPVVQCAGFRSGVESCGFFYLEFGVGIIATPAIVYFLVRVAERR